MLCEANVKYGRERAAARVLEVEVEVEEAEEGALVTVGDAGTIELPTAPEILGDGPCFGVC